jgi:hypothetical protein
VQVQTLTATRSAATWSIAPTTALADGSYTATASQADDAGNSTTTSAISFRVDTQAPAVTITAPSGATNNNKPTFSGAAGNATGDSTTVTVKVFNSSNVLVQTLTATRSAASWSIAPTTALTDGSYDLRSIATDGTGRSTTSATLTRKVDNTAPSAADVQGANGGTSGKLDAGDTLTFSYSETMAPASILSGWSGSSTAVQVKLTNGSGGKDLLAVWNSAGTTRLNLTASTQDVQLNNNWVGSNSVLNATVVQSGSQIIVTIGSFVSGSMSTGVTGTTAIAWTPSTTATDVAGNACSSTAKTESGAADVDF